MKVLDIITETQFNPRNLSDDQIMAVLQEEFRRNPNGARTSFTEEPRLSFFAQRRANAAQVEAVLEQRWGIVLRRFLVAAQIAAPIYMWYGKMQALNELSKEKDENGQYTYSDDYIIGQRNGITGICVISIVAVPIMKGVVAGTFGIFLKELLKAVARNGGGRVGGAAIVVATFAAGAGYVLFAAWLNTPAGVAFIREWIPDIIINGIGWVANIGIDAFTGYVKKQTGVDISPDPDTKKRIADIPDLNFDYDPDKERAKIRAGSRMDVQPFKTEFDYNHNGQNY